MALSIQKLNCAHIWKILLLWHLQESYQTNKAATLQQSGTGRVQKGYRQLQQTMKEHQGKIFSFLLISPKIPIYRVANFSIWRVSSCDMENIVQVTELLGWQSQQSLGPAEVLFCSEHRRVSPPSLSFAEISSSLSSILGDNKVLLVFLIALKSILGLPHWESSITILCIWK